MIAGFTLLVALRMVFLTNARIASTCRHASTGRCTTRRAVRSAELSCTAPGFARRSSNPFRLRFRTDLFDADDIFYDVITISGSSLTALQAAAYFPEYDGAASMAGMILQVILERWDTFEFLNHQVPDGYFQGLTALHSP
jgi:hypothetical protein